MIRSPKRIIRKKGGNKMNCLYLIATGAARNPASEEPIWQALRAEGMVVRDIHELPRIAQHDVAITDAAVARLVKKRLQEAEKPLMLICLVASKEVLAERLAGFPPDYAERMSREIMELALDEADCCVPSDEPEVAARLLAEIIRARESES